MRLVLENTGIYLINLQLFADDGGGEKTEKATPRRREEARKKGQVFKSADLNSAIILVVGSIAIFFTFPFMTSSIENFTQLYILDRTLEDFDNAYASYLLVEIIVLMAKITWPILAATFLTALILTYLQVGFVFSGEAIAPKLERINPLEGFKRIFSKRSLVELVKSLMKIGITGYIVYTIIKKNIYIIPRFVDMEMTTTLITLGSIMLEMALKVGLVFTIIGIIDYIYQRYEHEKSLMMSKNDVKQEYKQVEGDPLIKSKQRQIQREASMRRMMAEVPKADVIITNPTHFAVALKYLPETMDAPQLVAKGQDFIAFKIREIAETNNIVIVENPPLARTLFYSLEIGDTVPEALFHAVAEVLAFVYKQKRKVL